MYSDKPIHVTLGYLTPGQTKNEWQHKNVQLSDDLRTEWVDEVKERCETRSQAG